MQTARTPKIPGPDHPIVVTRSGDRVLVKAAGRIVVDTRAALLLQEASYPAVYYLPRKDADMTLLSKTDHATYCPYKGECSYYSIAAGGEPLQERGLDLRIALSVGNGNQRTPGLLSRPRRLDRHQSVNLGAATITDPRLSAPSPQRRRSQRLTGSEYSPATRAPSSPAIRITAANSKGTAPMGLPAATKNPKPVNTTNMWVK